MDPTTTLWTIGAISSTMFWTIVGAVSSAVAALAATAAVIVAFVTVRQGMRARTDADKAHAEAISEMRTAQEAAASSHAEQMNERRRALAEEAKLRRIEQVERVADVLADIAEVAQREAIMPPGRPIAGGEDRIRLWLLPAMIARLGAAQAALDALGGPDLGGVRGLVSAGYAAGGSESLVSAARNCLDEIRGVLQDPSHQLSPDANIDLAN